MSKKLISPPDCVKKDDVTSGLGQLRWRHLQIGSTHSLYIFLCFSSDSQDATENYKPFCCCFVTIGKVGWYFIEVWRKTHTYTHTHGNLLLYILIYILQLSSSGSSLSSKVKPQRWPWERVCNGLIRHHPPPTTTRPLFLSCKLLIKVKVMWRLGEH